MEWTKIIAIGAAIAVVWFTFKQKRPAPVQIAVIIGLLGGGYYFFFMEDEPATQYSGGPLAPYRSDGY